MLKTVGAGGHYPTNKLQAEDGEEEATPSTMLTMLADNVMGRAQALAETVLLVFYKVSILLHSTKFTTENDALLPGWQFRILAACGRSALAKGLGQKGRNTSLYCHHVLPKSCHL